MKPRTSLNERKRGFKRRKVRLTTAVDPRPERVKPHLSRMTLKHLSKIADQAFLCELLKIYGQNAKKKA